MDEVRYSNDNIVFVSGYKKENEEIETISIPYLISENKKTVTNLITEESYTLNDSSCVFKLIDEAFKKQYDYKRYEIRDASYILSNQQEFGLKLCKSNKNNMKKKFVLYLNRLFKIYSHKEINKIANKVKYENKKTYLVTCAKREGNEVKVSCIPYYRESINTLINLSTGEKFIVNSMNDFKDEIREVCKKKYKTKSLNIRNLETAYRKLYKMSTNPKEINLYGKIYLSEEVMGKDIHRLANFVVDNYCKKISDEYPEFKVNKEKIEVNYSVKKK